MGGVLEETAAGLERRMRRLKKLAEIDGPVSPAELDARLKKIDKIIERGLMGHDHARS